MKNILNNLLKGLFYFIIQTMIEILIILALVYFGIPYFGMGKDDFLQVLAGIVIYFGLSKVLYLGVLYLLLFVLFSLVTNINLRILNALLSVFLFLLTTIYFGRSQSTMINPIISVVISSIMIFYLLKNLRFFNRTE